MVKAKQFVGTFLLYIILALPLLLLEPTKAWAEKDTSKDAPDKIPNTYGVGATFGYTYDPHDDINFLQLNAFTLCDYERVWKHPAPDALRFKVEYNLGITLSSPRRAILSLNALALYYLDTFSSRFIRPYIEGGIGVIYTDYQVDGQGLRFNFNPQCGVGTEILVDSKPMFYISLRAHHVSNGELFYRANRGMNSVVLVVGRLF